MAGFGRTGSLGEQWQNGRNRRDSERTCKPGSVPSRQRVRCRGGAAISLGRRLLGASSSLPECGGGPDRPARSCPRSTLFGLAPGGVCLARLVTQPAGELLPHRFTLTADGRGHRLAVCFLLHFPGPCGRWALPTTLSCGARTFLPAGLPEGSACRAAARSTPNLTSYHTDTQARRTVDRQGTLAVYRHSLDMVSSGRCCVFWQICRERRQFCGPVLPIVSILSSKGGWSECSHGAWR